MKLDISMKVSYFRAPSQLCYTLDVGAYQHGIVSKCKSPWMYSKSKGLKILHFSFHRNILVILT